MRTGVITRACYPGDRYLDERQLALRSRTGHWDQQPDTIRVIAGTFFDNKPFSTEARPYGPEDFGDLAPDPSPGPVYNYTPEVAFG
jgi:hypothetical protein